MDPVCDAVLIRILRLTLQIAQYLISLPVRAESLHGCHFVASLSLYFAIVSSLRGPGVREGAMVWAQE